MKKITQELLERYHRGSCTSQEREAVETWLELDDDRAENPFTEEKIDALKDEVWKAIEPKIDGKEPVTGKLRLKAWHYGAAASIGLLFTLFFFQNTTNQNFFQSRHSTIADKTVKGKEKNTDFLLVNSSVHDHQKFTDTDCAISFQGRINVYNGFSEEIEIVCNGTTLKLQPNQHYTMFSAQGDEVEGFSMGRRNSGPIGSHSSQFKVCT
ncbi:MAG: hypothetical protein AAGC45_14555 [Bacteroidota bacterium]